MKETRHAAVKNKRSRTIKSKNMRLDHLLMDMFDFKYAGKANIFIHTRRDKFELVIQGVHIVEDIYAFSPNYIKRYQFETLYYAILGFNLVVQIITNNVDWYSPECFQGLAIYDELFFKD